MKYSELSNMINKAIENYFPAVLFITSFSLYSWVFFTDCLIGRDEGQFLYLGKQIADGNILYVDIPTARAPIPLLVIGFFSYLLDGNLHLLRLLVPLNNFLISFFIYSIGKTYWNSFVGYFSSIMYIFSYSMPLFEEMYLMTDSFEILFGIISIFYYLKYNKEENINYLFFSGIFVSFSFLSKQYGLLFFAVISFYEIIKLLSSNITFQNSLYTHFIILLGFLTPLLLFFGYYWVTGNVNYLITEYIIGTSSYTSFIFRLPNITSFLTLMASFSLIYLFAFYYSIIRARAFFSDYKPKLDHLLIGWAFVFSLLMSISTSGPYIFHTLPPSVLLSAIFIDSIYSKNSRKDITLLENFKLNYKFSYSLLTLSIFLVLSNAYLILPLHNNMTLSDQQNISDFVAENTNSNQTLLVYHYAPVFYYLSDVDPPDLEFSVLNIGPQFLTESKLQSLIIAIEEQDVKYLIVYKGILEYDDFLDSKYPVTLEFKNFISEKFILVNTEFKKYDIYMVN